MQFQTWDLDNFIKKKQKKSQDSMLNNLMSKDKIEKKINLKKNKKIKVKWANLQNPWLDYEIEITS